MNGAPGAWTTKIPAFLERQEILRHFLPLFAAEELAGVGRLVATVVKNVEEWCVGYPMMKPWLAPPTVLWAVNQLPRSPASTLEPLSQMSLWLLAFDDFLDEQARTEREAVDTIRECVTIACGANRSTRPANPYAQSLMDVEERLSKSSIWSRLQPYWAVSLCRVMDGSMYEYWLKQRALAPITKRFLPDLEEYLYFARFSIGFGHLWLCRLILEEDLGAVAHVDRLAGLAEQCALVVRVANDIATYEREREEGGPNAVAICYQGFMAGQANGDPSVAVGLALEAVGRRLEHERSLACRAAEASRGRGVVKESLVRGMELSLSLYRHGDLRDWASG